jgi:hypothetical protein
MSSARSTSDGRGPVTRKGKSKMVKYEKNSSTRRSTPKYPIAMASTAKPPDPMPCAQSAILLPESHAPACHMRKTLFLGQSPHTCDGVRSWAVPARGVRSCGVRRRRDPGQRHGCGGSVSGVAGGRRPLEWSYSRPGAHAGTVCWWACRGLGDAVRSGGAGLSVRGYLG